MFRCILSLVLTVQLLLMQLMACHCHAAAGHASCGGGATPHLHLSSLPRGCRDRAHGHAGHSHHCHSHAGHLHHDPGHDHDPADEGTGPGTDDCNDEQPCSKHRHGHGSDAYHLPDGWHAQRPSVRPVSGTFAFALVPPDVFDLTRIAGVRQACRVPPDPEPPGMPVYLRTLRLLV